MKNTKQPKALLGFIWKTAEQYSLIGMQFVLQIILARLIAPEEYGVIAIVSIFVSLSNVVIQKGFALSIVQKKNSDELDFSSVLVASLMIAAILYFILFVCSRIISSFFGISQLVSLIRVMALVLFPGAIVSVENAKIQKDLLFKLNFYATAISVFLSGSLGVISATRGLGVWALVIQQVSLQFLQLITLSIGLKWKWKFTISIKRLKELLGFGWKVLVTALVDELFVEVRSLIIGKRYDSASLSFYNRGQQFPMMFMKSIIGSLQAVLLPVLSKQQDNVQNIKFLLRKTVRYSTFFLLPALCGLALVSSSLVPLLLTAKWNPCIIFVQLFCILYATWPIITSVEQALYSIGKSNIVMRTEIIRKIIDLVIIIITMRFGVLAIAIGAVSVSVASVFVYFVIGRVIFSYSFNEQIKDIIKPILATAIMAFSVFCVQFFCGKGAWTMVIQIILGFIVYVLCAYILKDSTLQEVVSRVKVLKGKEC